MTEQDILNAGYKEYPKIPFDHEGIEKIIRNVFVMILVENIL